MSPRRKKPRPLATVIQFESRKHEVGDPTYATYDRAWAMAWDARATRKGLPEALKALDDAIVEVHRFRDTFMISGGHDYCAQNIDYERMLTGRIEFLCKMRRDLMGLRSGDAEVISLRDVRRKLARERRKKRQTASSTPAERGTTQ